MPAPAVRLVRDGQLLHNDAIGGGARVITGRDVQRSGGVARARLFGSTAFALLVGAIRRGTRLATAMEARGFDSGVARTSARTAHFGRPDVLVIVGGIVLATVALLAGLP